MDFLFDDFDSNVSYEEWEESDFFQEENRYEPTELREFGCHSFNRDMSVIDFYRDL